MTLAGEREDFVIDGHVEHRCTEMSARSERRLGDFQLRRMDRAKRTPASCASSATAAQSACSADRSPPGRSMNHILMKSGFCASSFATSARASSAEATAMIEQIVQVELRIGDGGTEAGDQHPAGAVGPSRPVARLEVPHRTARVDDAGDAAREPDLERRVEPRLVPRATSSA